MAFIPDSDILRDVLAAQFSSSFSTYHTLVDNHIIELADEEQLTEDEISVDDDGYLSSKFLRRYAAAWVCKEIFKDKMGINNNTLADEEKYKVKYEMYLKEVDNMGKRISRQHLTNEIETRMDTAKTGYLFRS